MGESGSVIDFDRAEYGANKASAAPCASCKRPLEGEYWMVRNSTVCESCRGAIEASVARATSAASLGKAALQGGGVALACGAAYAIFVAESNFQHALLTVGMAFVIAKVVRKASGGVGGLRFQILAVALTYLASAMGYLPPMMRAISDQPAPHQLSALLIGYALAAPFLEAAQAPLGLLIVGFGLWEAWKLTKEAPIVFDGPYRIGQAAAAASPP